MLYALTAIVALALGFLVGYWWARITEVDYWKPYIIGAYRRGREAGMSKRLLPQVKQVPPVPNCKPPKSIIESGY